MSGNHPFQQKLLFKKSTQRIIEAIQDIANQKRESHQRLIEEQEEV